MRAMRSPLQALDAGMIALIVVASLLFLILVIVLIILIATGRLVCSACCEKESILKHETLDFCAPILLVRSYRENLKIIRKFTSYKIC